MFKWQDLVVESTTSLRSVMELIDRTGLQTALVTSKGGIFLGTLTDGDIRRAILVGAELSSEIDSYVNRQPVTIASPSEIGSAYDAMDRLAIRCIPIVENGKITGVISRNKVLPSRKLQNPVLIMAGGRGERLMPFTNHTPKPLMKVGGTTLIEILLDRLASAGFSEIWIAVHYLSEQIEQLIGNGEEFGLSVKYVREKTPLGTAGAYLHIPEDHRKLPTLIVNADLLTNVNFAELLASHEASKAKVTIGVIEHLTEIPFGVVTTTEKRVTAIVEKPTVSNLVYAGVGVYEFSAFEGFESGSLINATDIYAKLLDEGKEILIFEISGYWRDIGTGESLQNAQLDLGIS